MSLVVRALEASVNSYAAPHLRSQFLERAADPTFRARADIWAKVTGRGPIDWAQFTSKLEASEFRTFATKVEAASGGWAGRAAEGERWLFGAPLGGKGATGHELMHALQDVKTGLFTREPGWFRVVAAEYSAMLYGHPAVGVPLWAGTAAGIGYGGYEAGRAVFGEK